VGSTQPPDPSGSGVLERGDAGAGVVELQQRLDDLGYWVGAIDGGYGNLTEQAVYAFEKVQGLPVDGKAGPAVRTALLEPVAFDGRTTTGIAWEIDKERQILALVRDGAPVWIWNTSTGTEEPYTHDGRHLMADTPVGEHEIRWQIDGWRNGTLGPIYRPKYFHRDGLAIHGYRSVPPVPASHGCVRVTLAAMDFIWETGAAPVGSRVVVYGTTPT
jgi:hypothetical protein